MVLFFWHICQEHERNTALRSSFGVHIVSQRLVTVIKVSENPKRCDKLHRVGDHLVLPLGRWLFSSDFLPPFTFCRFHTFFFSSPEFCWTSLLHFFHVAIWLWRLVVRECIWNQFDSKQKGKRRGRREVNGSPFLSMSTVSRHGPEPHKPNYSFVNTRLKCSVHS